MAFTRQHVGCHQGKESALAPALQQQVGNGAHHACTEATPIGHHVVALR